MAFLDNYSIIARDDAREVQRLTSYINCKQDGVFTPLNCQLIDEIIEECARLHGTESEPHLYYSLSSRHLPWFKHFEINRDVLEDSDELSDGQIITDYIQPYLSTRNMILKDFYRLNDVDLTTLIWSYIEEDVEKMIIVTPGLSNGWNNLILTDSLPIEAVSNPTLPIYNSTMSYWGRDDDNTFMSCEELDEDSIRTIYTDLFKPSSFVRTLDDDRDINAENLTESLIDILDDEIVMSDMDLFKTIGEAYLSVSRRSVPYTMHRWTERFIDHLEGDKFEFPTGSLSILDMRDHLNKSKSTVSWKTMAMYVRKFDRRSYNDWHLRWMKETNVTGWEDHHGVGIWFYKIAYNKFIYSSMSDEWYVHDTNIWRLDYKSCAISKELPTVFRSNLEVLSNSMRESSEYYGAIVADRYRELVAAMNSVLSKISNVNYIGSIVKISKTIFMSRDFTKLLDADPDVLNTPSCIIQFTHGQKPVIRQATAEDYVSKVTGVSYNANLNWQSFSVKLANDFIHKLFPNESTRNEVLKSLAYLLAGGNRLKKFIVMTGPKDTGKSTFKKFITDILSGDDQTGYSRDVPVSVIAKEQKQGAAMPELVQCKNAKTAWFTEPDDTVSLNNGTLKGISGGDSFFARGLYQNGGNIEPDFKMIMQCNKVPNLKDFDRPTLERMFIIPFETVFTIDAPADEEEQRRTRRYPLNPDFYKQNDLICEGLFWIMVQYIDRLYEEGLDHRNSEEMIQKYESYVRVNNYFADFVEIYLRKVGDDEVGSVSEKIVLRHFKDWFRKENRRPYTNTYEHIIEEFSNILGSLRDYNYNGIQDRIWDGWTLRHDPSSNDMTSF